MSAYCLICNLSLEESYKRVNIFNTVDSTLCKLDNGKTVSNTLFEVLGLILNRPLNSVILQSEEICVDCYSKAVAISDVQSKLQKLQSEFVSLFNRTVKDRTERDPLESDFCRSRMSMDINLPVKQEKSNSHLQEPECAIDESPGLERIYGCEKCGKNFNSNNDWVEHVLSHIDPRPHACSICGKTFRSASALKFHERAHQGFKIYDCEICGKSFSERHYLNEHARVHSNRKPFKCSECDREFARRKDMMTHVKLHTGEKPHSCPHCPKKFVVRSRLNRHLKTHMLERPYQCAICQKSFIRLNDFQIHERLHTGVKPFKCPECGKCFSSKSNFRAHERRHINANKKKTEPVNMAFDSITEVNPPVGDSPAGDHRSQGDTTDPLDMQLIEEGEKTTESKKEDMDMTPVEGSNSDEHQPSQEVMLGPVIFSAGESQPADSPKVTQRLPSLVNFRNPPLGNKSVESTLPLGVDLSNVTLPSEDSNVIPQQPYVLMQFPLLPEPPPLVLYSAPRNTNQAAQLANSILAETVSHDSVSQIIRWDNPEDVEALLQDNSNVPLLAQSLFQSKVSDAF